MNNFTEALLFAEDLMIDYVKHKNVRWKPSTSGNTYRSRIISKYTKEIGIAVLNLSSLQNPEEKFFEIDPRGRCYLNHDVFQGGYSAINFLEYCVKLASESLHVIEAGYDAGIVDDATLTITNTLVSFMRTGEFERAGGWSNLQEMGLLCSKMQVLRTIKEISDQTHY
ncbi:uncharacterized protein NPIL_423391 [Nephila pilipes]|uniref:Uncharacterized protein n=1 Tax=Nephila pilipes TaxID=299642 RepID=A0A8X6UIW7_NEPPI|nr:uncharacterized protein NPIL_423391 [Nephila pilipes]